MALNSQSRSEFRFESESSLGNVYEGLREVGEGDDDDHCQITGGSVHPSSDEHADSNNAQHIVDGENSDSRAAFHFSEDNDEVDNVASPISASGEISPLPQNRKRPWIEGANKDTVPPYDVKQSKRLHSQQRAISWLTATGRDQFDQHIGSMLADWGVTRAHKGTCVLLPAAWAAIDPMNLLQIYEYSKTPLANSDSPVYKLDDHLTSLTRAAAWFDNDQWNTHPRRGVDLDAFLNSSYWQRLHGSHICHDDLCIIHVVLDPVTLNEHRKHCHERAIFLRGERKPVPERCDCQTCVPRCYLRLAALTRYERCLRQCTLLRQARGLPPIAPPGRPHRHPFYTFESGLDLKFCNGSTPSVAPTSILSGPPTPRDKPDLICPFCDRIASYAGIITFWSHIFHKHTDKSNAARLEVIRQNGRLWREYFVGRTHRGRNDSTMVKLSQVDGEDFSWELIVSWQLRE